MEYSVTIAGIIGPILMILAISEHLNFKIWQDVHPTVVFLNGFVLLTLGLIVVRIHNFWSLNWELTITIVGWILLLLGLIRMFFPKAPQPKKNMVTNTSLMVLLFLGAFLSVKAYLV